MADVAELLPAAGLKLNGGVGGGCSRLGDV